MVYCSVLILLIFVKLEVKCEENQESKSSVKFLLSDAKDPEFNLDEFRQKKEIENDNISEFRQKKIIEDDNVAAESIILPTLHLESHPYAVVVLPDLNKFASKTFKKGRLTLEDIISGSFGGRNRKENEEKRQDIPQSYEPLVVENNDVVLSDIPVIQVSKSDGEIIDLNQELNSNFATIPEEAEEEITEYIHDFNETIADGNSPDYIYDLMISTEQPDEISEMEIPTEVVNIEKTNMVPAKSLAVVREFKNNLEKYMISDLIADQDSEGEVESQEKNQHFTGKQINSNEKFKINAASLEKKSRVTFKSFPLKFNTISSTSHVIPTLRSLERVEGKLVSKTLVPPNQKLTLPNKILKVQSIQTLPIVNEFSSFQNDVPSTNESDQEDPNSATKNQFLTLGKARELRPVPVQENKLQEFMASKTEKVLSVTHDDEIEHTKQDKKSTGSNPSDYVELISKESTINSNIEDTVVPSEKPSFKSNLYLGSDTLGSAFEFVRAVGIPLSTTESTKKDSSHLLSKKVESSSSEQREQINQLIKLRKQLMLLDTSSFATENYGRPNTEINPETKIGSYRVTNSKVIDIESPKVITNIPKEKEEKFTEITTLYNNEQVTQPTIFSSNKEKKSPTMTWSKFLKSSAETEIPKQDYSTTPPALPTESIKFNHLESIKTPIKESFNLHTRNQNNQSEEINVVFEKFDLSNVIPSSNVSKHLPSDKKNALNQISYNLPELKIDDLTSYESQERNHGILQHDSQSLRNSQGNSQYDITPKQPKSQSNSLLPSSSNFNNIDDCDKNNERCSNTITTQQTGDFEVYEETPTLVEFVPRAFDSSPDSESPTVISTNYPYNQNHVQAQTVQLTTVASIQTVDAVQDNYSFTEALSETSLKVEPRLISTFTDFTVTNPVHRVSIEPTNILNTPYLVHNVLSLETVTQFATVTVMTPSPVVHTHTKVIEQTRYVTITKTIPSEPLYTSTILHVMPDPKTVTVSLPLSTVTSTISSSPTVTHTLYSTICNNLEDEYTTGSAEYNNYGINTENLLGVPTDFHVATTEFKESLNKNDEGFDEVFWPKTADKLKAWPEGFDTEKFVPSSENLGSYDNHLPDLEAEESGIRMTFATPNEATYIHRNRQRMSRSHEFEDSPLVYGVPFYGYRPIDNEFPTFKSPGRGNSMKIKV